MNLMETFKTERERELLNKAGVYLENRKYSADEIKRIEISIEEFILSHSTKNGDIDRLNDEYRDILRTIISILNDIREKN